MHMSSKPEIRRFGAAALLAVVLLGLLLIGYNLLNDPQGTEKQATTDNIMTAIDTSPVTVTGTVMNGKGSVMDVSVNQVIRGKMNQSVTIQVKMRNGHNMKKAGLKEGEEYIFALAPSSSDPASYYGMIEPFIFQLKDGHAVAITGDSELKAAFRDTKVTVEELTEQFNQQIDVSNP